MAVVGIDFGNLNSVIAVARKRGIDVIANEASSRETASLVGFKDDQRSMGEKANSQLTGNLTNTVSNFKRLLGVKYNAPESTAELQKLFCSTVETETGNVGFEVDFQGTKTFSAEQISAMLFTQLRKTIEADSDNKIKLQESVISVPPFFNYAQRKAVKDAATIAGMNCAQLVSEPLAVAVPWGLYKKDLPEDDKPLHVMFINFGESSLWASVVAFSKSKISVVSVASDPFLGGRDFDELLVNHFVEIIKEEYKMDVSKNKRALLRLKVQCEKVKKILTTNPESPIFVESIMNDVDVRSFIKRDLFEQMSSSLVERAAAVIKSALDQADLSKTLDGVELTGGASYIKAFQDCIGPVTGVEVLSHSLNKSEAVARGCALQCAIVSPQFRINSSSTLRDYNPYSIRISWSDIDSADENSAKKTAILFEKGCALNLQKKITFKRSSRIEIIADYNSADEFPFEMNDLRLASFVVPEFKPTVEGASVSIQVTFKIDASGLFSLQHARATETYQETVVVPVKADAAAPSEGAAAEPETKVVEKKKTSDIAFESDIASGYNAAQLLSLRQEELAMQASDDLIVATLDAKNALEGFAYDTQSKLQYDFSDWTPFASEEEKTAILASVDENLAWLYGEGEEAAKEQFQNRLGQLLVLTAPLDLRKNEAETRQIAQDRIRQTLFGYKAFIQSTDEAHAHISAEQRQPVVDKVNETEDWLHKMTAMQEALSKTTNPVLLTNEITLRLEALTKVCDPIVNTPKPAPKVEEPEKMETDEKLAEAEKPAETMDTTADVAEDSAPTKQASDTMDLDLD